MSASNVTIRPATRQDIPAMTGLLAALADWARKSGATRIQLLADRNNAPAFEFYGRLGFGPASMVCRRRMP